LKFNEGSHLFSQFSPSTLIGHWADEVEKFFDIETIQVMKYYGSPQQRAEYISKIKIFINLQLVKKSNTFLKRILECERDFNK
jgi:SNF2 family DNA or RNA helicase